MIKLIASDIDGTLLTNHGQIVPERTADLIRRLIDKGIYFTAASGRQYSNLRRMFDPISENICYAAKMAASAHTRMKSSAKCICHRISAWILLMQSTIFLIVTAWSPE